MQGHLLDRSLNQGLGRLGGFWRKWHQYIDLPFYISNGHTFNSKKIISTLQIVKFDCANEIVMLLFRKLNSLPQADLASLPSL
jgi:hypothetical protein